MLNWISGRFHAWAKGWAVLAFLMLDAFFMGFIMPLVGRMMKSGTGSEAAIDLQFFTPPDKMFALVESYGRYGRAFYRGVELTVDILYPIIYTLAFSLLISWLFQRGFQPESKIQKWNVMPLGAWLFDLLENLGIVSMLSMWPGKPLLLAWLTTIFTMVKWIFAGGGMALIAVGLAASARNGFGKKE